MHAHHHLHMAIQRLIVGVLGKVNNQKFPNQNAPRDESPWGFLFCRLLKKVLDKIKELRYNSYSTVL